MWPNPQEISYLVTFTEETFNGKIHFLCSAPCNIHKIKKIVSQSVYFCWQNAKAFSEHCQTSKMDLFVKIVNGWKQLAIFAKSSIIDVQLGSKLGFWLNTEQKLTRKLLFFTWLVCKSTQWSKYLILLRNLRDLYFLTQIKYQFPSWQIKNQ